MLVKLLIFLFFIILQYIHVHTCYKTNTVFHLQRRRKKAPQYTRLNRIQLWLILSSTCFRSNTGMESTYNYVPIWSHWVDKVNLQHKGLLSYYLIEIHTYSYTYIHMHAYILHMHIPQYVPYTIVTTNTYTGTNKALYSSYVNKFDIFSKCLYNKC